MRNQDKLTEATGKMLDELVPNWQEDEEFKQTPERMAKSLLFFTSGDTELQLTTFPTTYSGLVARRGITTATLCPHHFLPYLLTVDVAYLPKHMKLGISKLIRAIRHYSKVLMPQEELTDHLLAKVVEHCEPKGAILVITGYHTCESTRGVQADNVPTITASVWGEMLRDADLKEEALRYLGWNHSKVGI